MTRKGRPTPVIAALRRGNLAECGTDVCAVLVEIPLFKPGAGSAASTGMTVPITNVNGR